MEFDKYNYIFKLLIDYRDFTNKNSTYNDYNQKFRKLFIKYRAQKNVIYFNIYKYLCRYESTQGEKGGKLIDLYKAGNYLLSLIELVEFGSSAPYTLTGSELSKIIDIYSDNNRYKKYTKHDCFLYNNVLTALKENTPNNLTILDIVKSTPH